MPFRGRQSAPATFFTGSTLGPLPASLVVPHGVVVDPVTGRLLITVGSAVLVATFPAR